MTTFTSTPGTGGKKLTAESKAAMRQLFEGGGECSDCGGLHKRKCPRVKRECHHPNGNRIEVEYWRDGEYDDTCILWPEDVYGDD